MASKRMLITIAFVVLAIAPALAKEYVVGDDKGWTAIDPDYEAWVAGKEFHVGDKLVFKYNVGFHNVIKVDEASFQKCVPPETAEPLATGNDVITLEKPGKEWYICSVGKHCELKQKLAITVLPKNETAVLPKDEASAPSPSQAKSAASGMTASKLYACMAVAFGFLARIA